MAHILTARVIRTSDECCFANDEFTITLTEGSLVWLKGPSGAGKTLTLLHVLGIQQSPGMRVEVQWNPAIPPGARAGMLFQQGVLIDTLTVHENMALSLMAAGFDHSDSAIKKYIEMVGLKVSDLHKMPNQLSGGMLRRASLAQLLAQQKKLIALDEPFIGLDAATALSIVAELKNIQKTSGTALLLVSHREDIVCHMQPKKENCVVVHPKAPSLGGRVARVSRVGEAIRTAGKMGDYFGYSLPLILLAFLAAGFAISMLFADILSRMDVTDQILQIIDLEFGAADSPLRALVPMMKSSVKRVIDDYSPDIKASLYSTGMANLFVLELGPLLTALLLAGRIGGSYAGEIATMQATNQNRLLRTLGLSSVRWTLLPAAIAAFVAAPLLTLFGTGVALLTGAQTAEAYALTDKESYWEDVWASVYNLDTVWQTYPPFVLLYRSLAFMAVILVLAEGCGRWNAFLQPRGVPAVITAAVVLSGLLIIFADWGFSQILLRYGLF